MALHFHAARPAHTKAGGPLSGRDVGHLLIEATLSPSRGRKAVR